MAQNVQKPFFFFCIFDNWIPFWTGSWHSRGSKYRYIKSVPPYILIFLKGRIIKKIYLYCLVNISNVCVSLIKVVHFLITFLNLHTPISSHLSVSFRWKQHFDHNVAPKLGLEVELNMVTKDKECEVVFRPL